MENEFKRHTDDQRIQKIRDLLKELPPSCSDYIRSIGTTTSTLTRMAYVLDLRTFFEYIYRELPYFSQMENITKISDAQLSHLSARDVDGYTEYLSLYYKTLLEAPDNEQQKPLQNHEYGIMRKLSSLRSYFAYLFRSERVPGNVAALVPLPKLHEKPILRLEKSEMLRLLDTAWSGELLTERQQSYHEHTKVRDYAILMLFLGTGIRVSECVGIDLDDLDLDNGALLVTRKGGNQVILYFPSEVAEALKAYRTERQKMCPEKGHEQAFFLSLQNRRITQRSVQLMVKKYALPVVPLKKRISPHKLRSTYATNLYNETGDIYLVADALGHSNVNTTRKHYAAMTDARRREAASNTHLPGHQSTQDKPKQED